MRSRYVASKAPSRKLSEPLWHDDPQAWMDETVRDLMRWGGMDYADAYEEVYGVSAPDPGDDDYEEWSDDGDVVWGL